MDRLDIAPLGGLARTLHRALPALSVQLGPPTPARSLSYYRRRRTAVSVDDLGAFIITFADFSDVPNLHLLAAFTTDFVRPISGENPNFVQLVLVTLYIENSSVLLLPHPVRMVWATK